MEKPHILWHSNAPWTPTGYGAQTALFAPRLTDDFDIAISSFYGLEGDWLRYDGVFVLPGLGGNELGDAVIVDHAKAWFGGDPRDGMVVTLMDVWPLEVGVWRKLNVAAWCPVDHDPVPHNVLRFFRETGAVPIAMSRFGQEQLAEFDPLYVPHAVDTSVYKPIPGAREETKIPKDAFVVGMVAANKGNPSRKCFPQALEAFKAFHERHHEAVLYLHTEILGRINGVNLFRLVDALDLRDAVAFTDQYRIQHRPVTREAMAKVYSSLDVLLNASAGEGFGIPILEAQACGVPAIVTDFTAMPEVCGAGWHVTYDREWRGMDNLAGPSWVANPDIEDIVESLEAAYAMNRERVARQARAHAMKYDIGEVAPQMAQALELARQRFEMREPVAA